VLFLLVIDALIVTSIVLLEWHYIIDLFAGVGVAVVSILLAGRNSRRAKLEPDVVVDGGVTKTDEADLVECPQRGTLFRIAGQAFERAR